MLADEADSSETADEADETTEATDTPEEEVAEEVAVEATPEYLISFYI